MPTKIAEEVRVLHCLQQLAVVRDVDRRFGRELERIVTLFQPGFGARDRNDVRPLGEQPGECELTRGAALALRDRLDALHEVDIVGQVAGRETRMPPPRIGLGEAGRLLDLGGQQAAAERRIGHEGDAEFPRRAQRLLRLVPIEQRIFVLHRGDRVNPVGAPDRLRPRLAQSEKTDLALLHELAPWRRRCLRPAPSDRCGADSRDRSPRRRGA